MWVCTPGKGWTCPHCTSGCLQGKIDTCQELGTKAKFEQSTLSDWAMCSVVIASPVCALLLIKRGIPNQCANTTWHEPLYVWLLFYYWHNSDSSGMNETFLIPTRDQEKSNSAAFVFIFSSAGFVQAEAASTKIAIVVCLSKLPFINFSSFKAFLIIRRVNIWSTNALGYFRKRAYVNLPLCHRQSDSHHNTTHERRASFCIHRTCPCHRVFELPLGHLLQCTAIHFIFITLGCFTPLAPPPAPPLQTLCYP